MHGLDVVLHRPSLIHRYIRVALRAAQERRGGRQAGSHIAVSARALYREDWVAYRSEVVDDRVDIHEIRRLQAEGGAEEVLAQRHRLEAVVQTQYIDVHRRFGKMSCSSSSSSRSLLEEHLVLQGFSSFIFFYCQTGDTALDYVK